MNFDELPLSDEIYYGTQDLGYKDLTPVQEQAIPIILAGKDLIACAQTGTGKTAAFLVPLMQRLLGRESSSVRSLVLVPTRELAKQIDDAVAGLGYHTNLQSLAIYAGDKKGENWEQQKKALTIGADIVIATPGRLIQHLVMGYVNVSELEVLILDEADKMLEMGFLEDIQKIIDFLPKNRQTLMFSATMPDRIRQFAKTILQQPEQISLAVSRPAEGIRQVAYMVRSEDKIKLLQHVIAKEEVSSMIMFAARKSDVDQIERALLQLNLPVKGMHSNREQSERESIMNDFRNGKIKILVATDILSRGIDVDNISHVVNYHVPMDPEDYVHRIGRTARAGTTGAAITLVDWDDMPRFKRIEKFLGREVPKEPLPEGFAPGPDPKSAGRGGGAGGGKFGGGGRQFGNGKNRGGGQGGGGFRQGGPGGGGGGPRGGGGGRQARTGGGNRGGGK